MASLIIASRYNMGIGGGKPCNDELTAQKSEQQSDMNFISDNQAGAHPAVLAAISDAAAGLAEGYGEDALTAAAESRVRDVFETDCAVFFVTTGTAANALAMSALSPPWGAIYCHEGAHIQNDENTAVELYTGGARMVSIAGEGGKPDVALMRSHMEIATVHGVHNAKPGAISLSNVTESGTVYRPEEIARYRQLADEFHLNLHMDGARFANAVVASGVSPADVTWRAGVDCLSFGLTKNGGIATEAVVMFNPALAEDFAYRRKRAGHLWSKQRFLAAQWLALLENDLWLDNARHANAMAGQLAAGFAAHDAIRLPWSVDANELFPVIPEALREQLREAGLVFYDWPQEANMTRFVTHFGTDPAEIARALEAIAASQ
jgi:threonine aldolase